MFWQWWRWKLSYRNVRMCEVEHPATYKCISIYHWRLRGQKQFRSCPTLPRWRIAVLDHSVLQSQFYVVVLAEEGTFLKAAKRLRTAQSFITRKIGEIERGHRHPIFDRSTRSVRLTKFGRLIVPAFRLAVRESERAWELSENYSRLLNGPLRFKLPRNLALAHTPVESCAAFGRDRLSPPKRFPTISVQDRERDKQRAAASPEGSTPGFFRNRWPRSRQCLCIDRALEWLTIGGSAMAPV